MCYSPLNVSAFGKKTVLFLVSGAGAGYVPGAPGTAGTLIAIPLAVGLNRLAANSAVLAFLVLIGFIAFAIVLSTKGGVLLGQKDPQSIVIDEVAGFLVAYFLVPFGWLSLTAAFVLFRLFDIVKPFPIARLERLPGGSGIVLDDVMAGLYTLVIMQLMLAGHLL